MNSQITYVIDTSAFIKGMDVNILQDFTCYTTDGVIAEIKNSFKQQRIKISIQTGNLIIAAPDHEHVVNVKTIAQHTGDLPFLSEVDINVMALAITLKASEMHQKIEVITDDYSIQNVLSQIPIPTHSFLQKGIDQFIQWQIYCPMCKKTYVANDNTSRCKTCGIMLKRRPIDKK